MLDLLISIFLLSAQVNEGWKATHYLSYHYSMIKNENTNRLWGIRDNPIISYDLLVDSTCDSISFDSISQTILHKMNKNEDGWGVMPSDSLIDFSFPVIGLSFRENKEFIDAVYSMEFKNEMALLNLKNINGEWVKNFLKLIAG